jgi:hypothetical protein
VSIFSKIGKAVKKVGKIVGKPLISTVARTVVGSVPVLGGVVSAVGAVKSAIHPPTMANTANLSARTGAPAFGHPGIMHSRSARPRTPRARTTRARRPTRRTRASGGVSAKQRAARARFAKAAKRGRIKKGTRL